MTRFLHFTYSKNGAVFGLIDRTLIVAIIVLRGLGFKLISPASRTIINLKDGREGGSGGITFPLRHTFR